MYIYKIVEGERAELQTQTVALEEAIQAPGELVEVGLGLDLDSEGDLDVVRDELPFAVRALGMYLLDRTLQQKERLGVSSIKAELVKDGPRSKTSVMIRGMGAGYLLAALAGEWVGSRERLNEMSGIPSSFKKSIHKAQPRASHITPTLAINTARGYKIHRLINQDPRRASILYYPSSTQENAIYTA